MQRLFDRFVTGLSIGLTCGAASICLAQADQPSIFVANNGNLEGSVTSYHVNPDGSLTWVAKYVTGSIPNSQEFHPGTNAFSISITPNGKYVVTGHGTSSSTFEQLTFFEVNSDATLSLVHIDDTPDTPIDLEWITDEYLAVTATPIGNDFVIIYKFDPAIPSLTQVFYSPTATTTYYIAVHPSRQFIYTGNSSGGNSVSAFAFDPEPANGAYLSSLGTYPAGIFPLGPGVSPDGTKLYFGGGISSDDHRINGFHIDPKDGTLTDMTSDPYFYSPGVSPKQVVISSDNQYAFASHGTDATIRGFSINQATGELTDTGVMFDVGGQGDCGNMAVMSGLLFVTDRYTSGDGVRGTYSFTMNPDGTLTQNGPLVDSQGVSPWDIAVWPGGSTPLCPADISGDTFVGVDDLLAVINAWGPCADPRNCPADIAPASGGGNDFVDVDDLLAVVNAWGPCR